MKKKPAKVAKGVPQAAGEKVPPRVGQGKEAVSQAAGEKVPPRVGQGKEAVSQAAGEKVPPRVGQGQEKETDEEQKRTVDQASEKANITPRRYVTKRVENGIEIEEGEDWFDLLKPTGPKDGKLTWKCNSVRKCPAHYYGVLLSDGVFYGWCHKPHTHGAIRWPDEDYDEKTGLLLHYVRLLRYPGLVASYEPDLIKLDAAIGETGAADATVYHKLAGDDDDRSDLAKVSGRVEYIGETTTTLTARFTSHSRTTNLVHFTHSGPIFRTISVNVSKKARHAAERLITRVYAHSPRLINKRMGPVDTPGLTRDEQQRGAALKAYRAIQQGEWEQHDWREKLEELKPPEVGHNDSLDTTGELELEQINQEQERLKKEQERLKEHEEQTRHESAERKRHRRASETEGDTTQGETPTTIRKAHSPDDEPTAKKRRKTIGE